MGILLLGHISTIEFYDLFRLPGTQGRNLHGTEPVDLGNCSCLSLLGPACTSTQFLGEQLESDLPHPIHLIVPQRSKVTATSRFIPHGWRYDQPLDDLFRLFPSNHPIYVCPPEMALMQMARKLSRPQLALLIDQLAGTYRIIRREAVLFYQQLSGVTVELYPHGSTPETCERATAYGLRRLTTKEQLRNYVEAMPGAWGSRLVKRALTLTADGLASPLEAQQHVLAFCNVHAGSLGLPLPLINTTLKVPESAWTFFGVRQIRPDFYWPEEHVALETNGLQWHGGKAGIASTSRRTKGYEAMGIRSMTITHQELANSKSFYTSMAHLAAWLGKPLPQETARFVEARNRLFQEVTGHAAARKVEIPDYDTEWLDHLAATYDITG